MLIGLLNIRIESMNKIINHIKGNIIEDDRFLLEPGCNIFIRYNEAISILRKVQFFFEPTLNTYVSSSKPFGMRSNFCDFKDKCDSIHNIKLYRFGDNGYVSQQQVLSNTDLINRYKVIVSKAWGFWISAVSAEFSFFVSFFRAHITADIRGYGRWKRR